MSQQKMLTLRNLSSNTYPNPGVLGVYIVHQHPSHPRIARENRQILKRPTGHREIQQRSAPNPDLYMVVSPNTKLQIGNVPCDQ